MRENSLKNVVLFHSRTQRAAESKSHQVSPEKDRMEPKVQLMVQRSFRGSRHTPAIPCYRLLDSSPERKELEARCLNGCGGSDSDTDLSESERSFVSASGEVPPQLELRPEIIEADNCSSRRSRGHGSFNFPDFLPPPFNSWSLSQLAVFYNMEGWAGPQLSPVGRLERYLERLLQLEWQQIQTAQEENGKLIASDNLSSCHSSTAAVSSRLSSPKCILQCQRAFHHTFFPSLVSHSVMLSSCSCTLCCICYSTCRKSCCRCTHSHTRQSRLTHMSPKLESKVPTSFPKRSYSESRVYSSQRSQAAQTQRFSSPVKTTSHLRRMQASGNIRSFAHGANIKPHSTARISSFGAGREPLGGQGNVLDYRTGEVRKRSISEQRRGRTERQQGDLDRRQRGYEYRRGRTEQTAELKEREIKPDAVTAIIDNLNGPKHSLITRANRVKQVEFVT